MYHTFVFLFLVAVGLGRNWSVVSGTHLAGWSRVPSDPLGPDPNRPTGAVSHLAHRARGPFGLLGSGAFGRIGYTIVFILYFQTPCICCILFPMARKSFAKEEAV